MIGHLNHCYYPTCCIFNYKMICIFFLDYVGVIPSWVAPILLSRCWHRSNGVSSETHGASTTSGKEMTISPFKISPFHWNWQLKIFIAPLSQLYLRVYFLNAHWPRSARQKRTQYSVVQCDRAFLGQVAALRVTRHFWHVDGCSPAAAEHLCSQRLAVRISVVQLPCSSQLTNLGLLDLFAPISRFNLSHIYSQIHCYYLCYWQVQIYTCFLSRLCVRIKEFHAHITSLLLNIITKNAQQSAHC